jgi:CRP/FNR family transcriptional regulator
MLNQNQGSSTMPSDDLKPNIRDLPLFSALSVAELRQLMRQSAVRAYKRHEIVFMEGDPYAGLYLVLSGHVKVFKTNPEGKEQIIHLVGPREAFADVPLFTGGPYPATAQALEDTRLLFIPRQAFLDLLHGNAEICLRMLGAFAKRLRQLVNLVESLSLKEVTARLARYLADEAKKASHSTFDLPISKANLAAYLGTIPETLSRSLRDLEDNGIISVQGKQIIIRDKVTLHQMAG